ncbi:glutathione S-transferase family protein [Caenimonas koreensis]|uniref:Glutathione S-transferase family protein n=1 Tax=Caenimonas koreensis DSM 17982 TaxID=1121255 RepID=A0A844AYD3_9BURK|nr:glutathione S-transferase family protein [Caenimonas koreensis]MRD49560.1 glutathione S-transferase family protein [Caenimonas koreensis DSM 17982]
MSLTLHYHPLSSYCHKVLIALYELDLAFEAKLVNFGDAGERAAFEALWPTGKIPLLVDGEHVVPETSVIIEYLQGRAGARTTLIPTDAQAALEVRLWDRLFDLYVMTPMQAIIADRLREPAHRDALTVSNARAALAKAYDMIEQHLAGRTWAAGDQFSMADCAAAPSLFYACTLVPYGDNHPLLSAYFERLVARPSVARTLTEAKPFFQYYPGKEGLAARFLQ